jgi:hypothetical protein
MPIQTHIVLPNLRKVPTTKGEGAPLKDGFDMLNLNFDDLIVVVGDISERKVDKVDGKGLSTNDYSDLDKSKVDSLPIKVESVSGAQVKANVAETNAKLYADDLLINNQQKLIPADGSIEITEDNEIRVGDFGDMNLTDQFNNEITF